jgi:hypothetical protein
VTVDPGRRPTGAEWGSFSDVRTRFWGLVVAGFTAVVVHAYLWPDLGRHRAADRVRSEGEPSETPASGRFLIRAFQIQGPPWAWSTVGDVEAAHRGRLLIERVRHQKELHEANPDTVFHPGDTLAVAGNVAGNRIDDLSGFESDGRIKYPTVDAPALWSVRT